MKLRKPPDLLSRIPRLRQPEPEAPAVAVLDSETRRVFDAVNDKLDRVDEFLQETFTEPSPFRERGRANESATVAEFRLIPPMGFAWYVERYAYEASAGTPTVNVYVGSISGENFVDGSSGVIRNVSDNYQPIWIPEGTPLIFSVSAMAAGSTIGFNLQGKVVRA